MVMVLSLSAHILPFVTGTGVPAAADGKNGSRSYFKPIQVCDADDPFQGVRSDLCASPPVTYFFSPPEEQPCTQTVPAMFPESYSPGVYRPPRLTA